MNKMMELGFSLSCRSSIPDLGVDGNVWWVQVLGVSSLIRRGLSFTSHSRLSISSSSKGLLLLLLLLTLSENDLSLCLVVKRFHQKSAVLYFSFSVLFPSIGLGC